MLTLPKIVDFFRYFCNGYTREQYNHYINRKKNLEARLHANFISFQKEDHDDYWDIITYVEKMELLLYKNALISLVMEYSPEFEIEAKALAENILSDEYHSLREYVIDCYPTLAKIFLHFVEKIEHETNIKRLQRLVDNSVDCENENKNKNI